LLKPLVQGYNGRMSKRAELFVCGASFFGGLALTALSHPRLTEGVGAGLRTLRGRRQVTQSLPQASGR
jgi:hypothetical protein